MRYAFFPGCLAQTELYGYELSARETLPRLGVELVDLEGASCCGYSSYRVTSPLKWNYLTARNMALAEGKGLGMLTLCNNCNLSFCEGRETLEKDGAVKEMINQALSNEGLEYRGGGEVVHLLELLHDEIGTEKIADNVTMTLEGMRLAAHPGCHAFRPSGIGRPDEAEAKKLGELIRALGAESPDYEERLDCCGSQVYGLDGEDALKMAGSKLMAVKQGGFDAMVTTCPHCFETLDGGQSSMWNHLGGRLDVPVVLYTQLLGLAMGLEPDRLGLQFNVSPVERLLAQAPSS